MVKINFATLKIQQGGKHENLYPRQSSSRETKMQGLENEQEWMNSILKIQKRGKLWHKDDWTDTRGKITKKDAKSRILSDAEWTMWVCKKWVRVK